MNVFQTPVYLLPPLIAAGISVVLVFIVLRQGLRKIANRLFFLLIVTMAVWGLVLFVMRSSPNPMVALGWDRAMPALATAMGAFYLHFSLIVTRNERQRNLLIAGYTGLALTVLSIPTGLMIAHMDVQSYGYAPIFTPGMYVVFAFDYVLLGTALYNLIRGYRRALTYEEKNRLLYLALAMVFPLLGGVFEAFPIVYPTSIFGNIIFCLIATIAVLRYHLLDIRIVIRKGTIYLLTSTIVAIPYAAALLLFNILFGRAVPPWAYFILLIALALGLQPLWAQLQRRVDKLFYRRRYDFLEELEDFSQEVHDVRDLTELSSSLVKLISRALQSSSVQLLLPDSSGNFATVCSAGAVTTKISFDVSSPLLQWLQANSGVIESKAIATIPLLQSLTARESDALEQAHARLLIPLKTKEAELAGVLVMGEKLSQQPYDTADERLVLSVASRVAIELENAHLYVLERTMRRELQEQNEQKTEFLHSVAHELKTPLTAIIASGELLQEESLGNADSQTDRLIQNIVRSAHSMDHRVTELLDLARIQVGALKPKLEPLHIDAIAEEMRSRHLILFNNKNQHLVLDKPSSLPPVKADRERTEQVLINLLSNANKFSPVGGEVTIRLKAINRRVVVSIEDSAPVITQTEKERLFNPYFRGEDADKRQRYPGLGLGLAICKKLIELQQGEIWVESHPGKGNTFAFSVPIAEDVPAGNRVPQHHSMESAV